MTAPDRANASARRVRISDEQLAQDIQHVRHYGRSAHDTLMLPTGYIGDLRDTRQLAADQAARIAELERDNARLTGENEKLADEKEVSVLVQNYYDLGREFGCDPFTDEIVSSPFDAIMEWKRQVEARADRLASEVQAAREAALREAAEIAKGEMRTEPGPGDSWAAGAKFCMENIVRAIRARLSTEEEKP